MKFKKPFLILFVLCVYDVAYAWPDPYSYLNYMQDLKTAVNTTKALANQAEQISNQAKMIQWQSTNTKTVNDYQWQNIQGLIQKMDAQSQQGQALSYSAQNIDAQFRQKYADYSSSGAGQMNYQQAYQQWNASTLDTLRSAFNANQISAGDFQNEHEALMQLKNQGATATGRMEALQVMSEISAENVNQLQELKRIMLAQSSAQNSYMAYKVSQKSYQDKNLQLISDQIKTDFPKYQNNSKFGKIPDFKG